MPVFAKEGSIKNAFFSVKKAFREIFTHIG